MGRSGYLFRSIDEYRGVNNLTSWPAPWRYLVRAADTSAKPPVFESGATSDARRHTCRFIERLPVYDVAAVRHASAYVGSREAFVSSMRRFLIGIVLLLLLATSIGVGIVVARWPTL